MLSPFSITSNLGTISFILSHLCLKREVAKNRAFAKFKMLKRIGVVPFLLSF
uniref:Uncharacterized protein n=1 Tax=Nelumbo nucifera TaxID=4432 RepID=A0A822ZMA5_NELNU|nr:TPA_asm: hypothetical protein HUJ06_001128 [Nelumbo nucifera]